jgi:heme-degrading monooxygenase HmoA
MSIVLTQDMPGATKEMIEAVNAELHIDDDRPRGLVLHTATETPTGIRVVDVWDSEADFHAFEHDRLQPAISAVARRFGMDPDEIPVPRQQIAEVFDLR